MKRQVVIEQFMQHGNLSCIIWVGDLHLTSETRGDGFAPSLYPVTFFHILRVSFKYSFLMMSHILPARYIPDGATLASLDINSLASLVSRLHYSCTIF